MWQIAVVLVMIILGIGVALEIMGRLRAMVPLLMGLLLITLTIMFPWLIVLWIILGISYYIKKQNAANKE